MSKMLLQWAKSHVKDLKLDDDKLVFIEGNKMLLITFSNKYNMEIDDSEGIRYVKVTLPREGIQNVIEDLQRVLEG